MKWILYIGLLVVVGGFMLGLALAFLPNKALENIESKLKARHRSAGERPPSELPPT